MTAVKTIGVCSQCNGKVVEKVDGEVHYSPQCEYCGALGGLPIIFTEPKCSEAKEKLDRIHNFRMPFKRLEFNESDASDCLAYAIQKKYVKDMATKQAERDELVLLKTLPTDKLKETLEKIKEELMLRAPNRNDV